MPHIEIRYGGSGRYGTQSEQSMLLSSLSDLGLKTNGSFDHDDEGVFNISYEGTVPEAVKKRLGKIEKNDNVTIKIIR